MMKKTYLAVILLAFVLTLASVQTVLSQEGSSSPHFRKEKKNLFSQLEITSKLGDELWERYKEILLHRVRLWREKENNYDWKRKYLEFYYRFHFGIQETPEIIFQKATLHLMKIREKMEHWAEKHDSSGFSSYLEKVKNDCPHSPQELLSIYKNEIDRSKNYIQKKRLAPIPPYARLVSAKLGSPRSGYAFGYFQRPFRPGDYGYFIVIPPSPKEKPEIQRQRYRSHNRWWAQVVAPHEAIPGHHLQITVTMAEAPLLQKYFFNPAFIEGWGLYSEIMLREKGYFHHPKAYFASLQMEAWRAARVIIDQGLYLGFLSPEECESLLIHTVGLEPLAAKLETAKQKRRPIYYSGYFIGSQYFLRIRERLETFLGKDFSLYWFHGILLKIGPIPLDLLEKELWRQAKILKKRKRVKKG